MGVFMSDKILSTRIKNKIDTSANWEKNNKVSGNYSSSVFMCSFFAAAGNSLFHCIWIGGLFALSGAKNNTD